jgi:hypothetical protein
MKWYAAVMGKRPGFYNDQADAQEQLRGHPFCYVKEFKDKQAAIDSIDCWPGSTTPRFFLRYLPKSKKSCQQASQIHASTQPNLTQQQKRTAKITAITCEIIFYYLHEGLDANQVDDEAGNIALTDAQKLSIYQAMCKQSRKTEHSTIMGCTAELKRRPYINIYDFVDTYRTGDGMTIRSFDDWADFRRYTMDHRRFDLNEAKRSDFLVPLLQILTEEPPWEPRVIRDDRYRPLAPYRNNEPVRLFQPEPKGLYLKASMPVKAEPPSTLATPQFSTSTGAIPSSRYDHPPLSPISACSSPISPTHGCDSSSRSTAPNLAPSTPLSSADRTASHPGIKREPTCPIPRFQEEDATQFIDQFEDDKEIYTQLTQQPLKVEEEDFTQDDDDVYDNILTEATQRLEEHAEKVADLGKRKHEGEPMEESLAKRLRTIESEEARCRAIETVAGWERRKFAGLTER